MVSQGPPALSRQDSDPEKHQHVEIETATIAFYPLEEKKILRKVDWRLVPLLQFFYMLTFLDRVNIGNARVWGLEDDLNMKGFDYNIAVLGMIPAVFIQDYLLNIIFRSVADHRYSLCPEPCSTQRVQVLCSVMSADAALNILRVRNTFLCGIITALDHRGTPGPYFLK